MAAWDSLGKGVGARRRHVVVVAGPQGRVARAGSRRAQEIRAGGGRAFCCSTRSFPGRARRRRPGRRGAPRRLTGQARRRHRDRSRQRGADGRARDAHRQPLRTPSDRAVRRGEGLPVVFPLARSVAKAGKAAGGQRRPCSSRRQGRLGRDVLDQLERRPEGRQGQPGPVDDRASPWARPRRRIPRLRPSRRASSSSATRVSDQRLDRQRRQRQPLLELGSLAGGEEKLVGIAPKTPEQASLALTRTQVNRIGLFAILGMPAWRSLLGVWVWYRRRD